MTQSRFVDTTCGQVMTAPQVLALVREKREREARKSEIRSANSFNALLRRSAENGRRKLKICDSICRDSSAWLA